MYASHCVVVFVGVIAAAGAAVSFELGDHPGVVNVQVHSLAVFY